MNDKIKERLKDKIVSWQEKNPKRHYIEIKKEHLRDSATILFTK